MNRLLHIKIPASVKCCSCSAGKYGLILLKNSSLIERPIADSIPVLNGEFGDDGTEAGSASGAVP